RPAAEGHGAGGHRQAGRLGLVWIRAGGRSVWRRRVRAGLLFARAEAAQGRDPAEQRVRAVAGETGGADAQINGDIPHLLAKGDGPPMADNDDLLKKLADNFHQLSERERKVLKEKLGIELMPLRTLEQVQAA